MNTAPRPPFAGPGGPAPAGAFAPPGVRPGMPPPAGMPLGPPGGLPGAPPSASGVAGVTSQMGRAGLGPPQGMPLGGPPMSLGGGPPPLPGMPRPMGPPGSVPGGMGPPPVPSSGTPIPMPAMTAPPSTNTGMLAGIPPGPPGMRPPPGMMGMMGNGVMPTMPQAPSSVGSAMRPPMGMPPLPGAGVPPPPATVGAPGMPPPPGVLPPPPGMGFGGPPGMPPTPPPPPGSMQRAGPPGAQGPAPIQQQNRIDPSQIPRPVASPAAPFVFETRAGGQHTVPPPTTARFVVRDRGNAGPRFMRATLNQAPCASDLLTNSAMPFAVVVTPLALPDPEDDQVEVVAAEGGPVRCGRCKAYMNPYMRFVASGRSFVCNFCGHSNPTPDPYFCHMGPDGRRRDADERAELCRGSVDWVATQDYMVRQPMAPTHFFLIDATSAAVASGATATVCSCISRVLDDLPEDDRTMVGFAAFDSSIQFFSVRPGASQPQMLVVPDVMDVYAPDSAPLLMPVAQHKEELQALLALLPNMFAGSMRSAESCVGAAIEAAVEVLRPTGGKVHAFVATLPTVGLHTLKARDTVGMGEKDKLAYLSSQDNTLKSLAATAADFQICIDISFIGQGYLDIASFSDLTSSTGGSVYQYTPFNPAMDYDQVLNDLLWNVRRPQGLEAVMRVRCSQGLEVESYLGAFCRQAANPTDVYLPAVDSDKAIIATLRHVEKLSSGSECYLQAALLYTSVEGHRRIRVHTLAIPITDNVSSMFKAADLDSQIAVLSRRLASSLPGTTLAAAREMVTNSTVATLAAYRKHCASSSSAVQLILPEALKLLPLYALSLLKGPALKDGAKPDERSYWVCNMMALPPARITPLLYPRLLMLHRLMPIEGDGDVQLPEVLPDGAVLSSETFESGGVYLLENGMDCILHLDKGASSSVYNDLLGVPGPEELSRMPQPPPVVLRENRLAKGLQALLQSVRVQRSCFLRLRVSRKGDASEAHFFNLLVEDRSPAGMSYVEYLCQVHRLIQMKMM